MDSAEPGEGWSDRYALRRRIRERYPTIWSIPVVKRPHVLLARLVRGRRSVLDIGAYKRGLEKWFLQNASWMRYQSLDVDRSLPHDFRDLDEVDERFDLVVMLEVIEHLDLVAGEDMMRGVMDVLEEGGLLVVSTPNPQHANRYFLDATHKVPYSYEELGSIFLRTGYELEGLYRVFNAPLLAKAFRKGIGVVLHRFLGIDYAPSLVGIGAKVRAE